jgi:acetate kinase
MRAIRELRPGDAQWQRVCDRLADAVLFAAGQGETHQPMRQTIYDALGDVLGDNVTPDELERLADVILKALR